MKQNIFETKWLLNNELIKEKVITNHDIDLESFRLAIINANSNEELINVVNERLNQFEVLEFNVIDRNPSQKPLNYCYRKLVYFHNHIMFNYYNFKNINFHNYETTITENEFLNMFIYLYYKKNIAGEPSDKYAYLEFKKELKNVSTEFQITENKKVQLNNVLNLINSLLCEFVGFNKNEQFANIAYKKLNKTQFNELLAMNFQYRQYQYNKETNKTQLRKIGLLMWEQLKKCFTNKQILKLLNELFLIWEVPAEEPEIKIYKSINNLDHLTNQLVVWRVKGVIKTNNHIENTLKENDTG